MDQGKLNAAIINFLSRNKEVSSHILRSFDFQLCQKGDTAHIYLDYKSRRYKVNIPKNWIKELTIEQLSAVIEHEVSHAFLKHIQRRGNRHDRKWNLAIDLFINETSPFIKEHLKPILPNSPWLDTMPLKKDITDIKDYTAEELYDLLDLEESNLGKTTYNNLINNSEEEKEHNSIIKPVKSNNNNSSYCTPYFLNKRMKINKLIRNLINALLLSPSLIKKTNPIIKSRRFQKHIPLIKETNNLCIRPYVLVGIDGSGSLSMYSGFITYFTNYLSKLNIQFDLVFGDYEERLFIPHYQADKNAVVIGYKKSDLSFIKRRFIRKHYDSVIIFIDGTLPSDPKTPIDKTILCLKHNHKLFSKYKKFLIDF